MKTTRSNFARKALVFGGVIFACVALIASGFAAYLISSGAESNGDGSIKVVTVSNADIKIVVDGTEDGTLDVPAIYYGPLAEDKTGYITHTGTSDNQTENLSFNVSGTIQNGDKVGTLSFSVRVPDGVVKAAGLFKNGEDWEYVPEKAYIMLPDYALDMNGKPLPKVVVTGGHGAINGETAAVSISIPTVDMLEGAGQTVQGFNFKKEGSAYKFSGTFNFAWGEAVGFGNPARTLDAVDNTPVAPNAFGVEANNVECSLSQAELLLRLVNLVVNGKEIDSTYLYDGTNAVVSSAINAYDINPFANLPANIVGDTQEAKMNNLLAALRAKDEEGTILSGATYKVYISAMPR